MNNIWISQFFLVVELDHLQEKPSLSLIEFVFLLKFSVCLTRQPPADSNLVESARANAALVCTAFCLWWRVGEDQMNFAKPMNFDACKWTQEAFKCWVIV